MKRPSEPLTPDEARKLIAASSRKCPTGLRNRALLTVLYRGGLRTCEALALFPKDLGDHELRILHGKGDKARTVGLDPGAWELVQKWVSKRTKLGMNGSDPLFCTLEGKPLQPRYVRQLVARNGKKAKIEKRCHPHGLRASHAVELMREGHNLSIIQRQLGHANIKTTDTYLRGLLPIEAVDAVKKREWSLNPQPVDPKTAELLRLKARIEELLAG